MSRTTILAVMRVRTGAPRRILLPLLALVIVAAAACSSIGPPPAASVDDSEISSDELTDVVRSTEAERRAVVAAQSGVVDDAPMAAVPSSTTAVALTALIYDEAVGQEVDPSGIMAETLATEPVGYLDNVLLSLGGAQTLQELEMACALIFLTDTPEQMTDVLASLPDQSLNSLQGLGASQLCIVRDDPRIPPEIVQQFWNADVGVLQPPIAFEAFAATGFDGAESPSAPGVILTGVIARGPFLSQEISAVGQPANDLLQAWGQPAAAAGQAEIVERLADIEITVDPRYGSWNGVQVVDPFTSRLEEEGPPEALPEAPLPEESAGP